MLPPLAKDWYNCTPCGTTVVRDVVEPLMAVTGCMTEVNPGAAVYLADESAAYRTLLAAGQAGSRHTELNANVVFGAWLRPASCP